MRTGILTLLLMLVATFAVQAQSLTDKNWFANMSDKENDITLLLTFGDDGDCIAFLRLKDEEEVDEGVTLNAEFNMYVPGTYTLQGRTVKMAFDTTKNETEISADLEGVDETSKSIMMSMIKPELKNMEPEVVALLMESLPTNDSYEITKLTDTELQFDGGFDFVGMPK